MTFNIYGPSPAGTPSPTGTGKKAAESKVPQTPGDDYEGTDTKANVMAGLSIAADIAGMFAAKGELRQQRDSVIRDAEMNQMILDYEESDLQENYADRVNIIGRQMAQEQGQTQAALAMSGVDVASVSATNIKSYQRELVREDLDALRSHVWSQQRGINIQRAGLKAQVENARAEYRAAAFSEEVNAVLGIAQTAIGTWGFGS